MRCLSCLFLLVYMCDWYQHRLVLWFSGSVCHRGWNKHRTCHRGSSSHNIYHWGCRSLSACHFVIRSRNLLFPLRVLSSVEQGSVGISQIPTDCSDLCLWNCQGDCILLPNILLAFHDSAHFQEFQNVRGGHCPRYLPILSHTLCHP